MMDNSLCVKQDIEVLSLGPQAPLSGFDGTLVGWLRELTD